MISRLLHSSVRYGFIPFSSFFGHDNVPASQLKLDPNEVKQTGWDRVKQMYTVNEFGQVTPELNSILQVGMMSAFFGGIYGGFLYSREAYNDFLTNNTATTFKDHLDAKRQLQDHITVNFGKGAFRWSLRLSFFSMSLVAITTTIQVYRNKYGIAEYGVAGGISGALYRLQMGPKAWVSGGVIGSMLGLLGGVLTFGLLKMAGISMQETHAWRYKLHESRAMMRKKIWEREDEKEDYAIAKLHNTDIGEAGHSLEALDRNEKVTEEKK